jgi:predicted aspartyl protease
MNRLYGVELASPTCELHVMVAENVADDKFLLGLDFLSRFRLLLDSKFLVMV